jgi:hypothetical protein
MLSDTRTGKIRQVKSMSSKTPGSVLDQLSRVGCEVRCDDLTRQLYATDASIYQIEPVAVAFPRATQSVKLSRRGTMMFPQALLDRWAGIETYCNKIRENEVRRKCRI